MSVAVEGCAKKDKKEGDKWLGSSTACSGDSQIKCSSMMHFPSKSITHSGKSLSGLFSIVVALAKVTKFTDQVLQIIIVSWKKSTGNKKVLKY